MEQFFLEFWKEIPHPFHAVYLVAWFCGISALCSTWLVVEVFKVKGDLRQDAARWVGAICVLIAPPAFIHLFLSGGTIVYAIWVLPFLPSLLFWGGLKQSRPGLMSVGMALVILTSVPAGEMIKRRMSVQSNSVPITKEKQAQQ